MILVKPTQITDSTLSANNVLENDYPAYDPAATYQVGDRVMEADVGVHKNFECLAANTSGVYPPNDAAAWLDLGATNAWAMFDTKVGTQTTNADAIAVKLNLSGVTNAIGLVNVEASSATVTVTDSVEGVVYQRTESLVDAGANDWYQYFFSPIERKSSYAFLDLPAYWNATIDVSIDYSGGIAKCGALVAGTQVNLGNAKYGLNVGILDYSRKEVDAFGNWKVIERGFSDTVDFDIQLDSSKVAAVKNALTSVRATPALYIGHQDYPETQVFGYYRDFQINLATPIISDATLTVEGLT